MLSEDISQSPPRENSNNLKKIFFNASSSSNFINFEAMENDTSIPNKIPHNFNDLILTKKLLGNASNPSLSKIFMEQSDFPLEKKEKIKKFSEEEDLSFENNNNVKLETGEILKLNRSANKCEESSSNEMLKAKKKFSSDYFNDRKRPGYPTLTQKKRDLAPLLEFESKEIISNRDSELQNQDEGQIQPKNEEKSKNYIINELENIERLKSYKTKMEKFVIMFNNKPQDGINYLIENKIKTSQEEIANLLLTYEGLSKELMGQYFGSPDSYNQEIFSYFCALLDFSHLELDQALRLLLSRFRLAGEAQQIDRIVQTFSKKYMMDCPKSFNDEDTPYILSYSAIMLSTDAHSTNIPQKNKMKKHQFVETNKKICPSVSREFLEGMYDRIVSQKFETQNDGFFF